MFNVGLDVETTRAPHHYPWSEGALLVALGIATEDGTKKTWVFNHDELPINAPSQKEMLAEIQAYLDRADWVIGANLKFDLNWLRSLGLKTDHCRFWCTQVTEYLLKGNQTGDLSLAFLSKKYGIADKMDLVKMYWEAGYETTEIPLSILLPYLEQDCINALCLFQKQLPKVLAMNMWPLHSIEMEAMNVLSEIECNGMLFNKPFAEAEVKTLQERLAVIDVELKLLFNWDVNLDSPDELSVALFGGVLKRPGKEWVIREFKFSSRYYQRDCIAEKAVKGLFIPLRDTALKKEGFYSTDKSCISRLSKKSKVQKQIREFLLERSTVTKALETFIGKDPTQGKGLLNKVQPDGRLHGKYNQTVTKTGRLSSSDPNQQNFPREGKSAVKMCILPRLDWISNADLSQIEWRGAAFLSQDEVMIKEILDGVDPHRENAIHLFGADSNAPKDDPVFKETRNLAKIVTFRLLYGSTAKGFYYDPDMPRKSEKEWQSIIDRFYEKYQGLKAWQDANMAYVNEHNGILMSVTGRYFHIGEDKKGYKRRNVCNYPVQAIATADLMKIAMVLIYREMKRLKLTSRIIGQVHDSLVFDTLNAELEVLEKLTKKVFRSLPWVFEKLYGMKFNVPITGDFEYGLNYGEMKKWEGKRA